MPIILTANGSHDGISELICVEVQDFADGSQVRDVMAESKAILGKIKGSKLRWEREDDLCYQVTSGLLRKDGGRKALDKVARALGDLGYGHCLERRIRKPEV